MSTQSAKLIKYLITGYHECRFFQKAQKVGLAYAKLHPEEVSISIDDKPYEEYHKRRVEILKELGKAEDFHKTCPIVVTLNDDDKIDAFVGGCDSTIDLFVGKFGAIPETKGPAWKV